MMVMARRSSRSPGSLTALLGREVAAAAPHPFNTEVHIQGSRLNLKFPLRGPLPLVVHRLEGHCTGSGKGSRFCQLNPDRH